MLNYQIQQQEQQHVSEQLGRQLEQTCSDGFRNQQSKFGALFPHSGVSNQQIEHQTPTQIALKENRPWSQDGMIDHDDIDHDDHDCPTCRDCQKYGDSDLLSTREQSESSYHAELIEKEPKDPCRIPAQLPHMFENQICKSCMFGKSSP